MRVLVLSLFSAFSALLLVGQAYADDDLSRPGLRIERGFDAGYSPADNRVPTKVLRISLKKAASIAVEIRLRTRPDGYACKFATRGLARLPGFRPEITDVFFVPEGTKRADLRVAIDAYSAKKCRWTAADIGVRYREPALDGAAFGGTLDWRFTAGGDTDVTVFGKCHRPTPTRSARTLLSCSFHSSGAHGPALNRDGGRLSLNLTTSN